MFDTLSILVVLALVMTFVSMRWYNIIFSLAGTLFWLGLWQYNLTNPPTGIAVGSFTQDLLTYAFIGMAIVTMLIYFGRRNRSYNPTQVGYKEEPPPPPPPKGIMEYSEKEYRARAKTALRPRRRR